MGPGFLSKDAERARGGTFRVGLETEIKEGAQLLRGVGDRAGVEDKVPGAVGFRRMARAGVKESSIWLLRSQSTMAEIGERQ